jgi:hexosaminidase
MFLQSHGRRLIGWDEIIEGGLAENAVVMSWQGEQGGIEAAKAGHDVVMAPYQVTYFDYYQSADRSSEPLAFPGEYTPLSRVYNYDPIPSSLPLEHTHHVLGSQGQLWSEYMPTTNQVEYMAFPRMTALAEVLWSYPHSRDFSGFVDRLKTHSARLEHMKINFRPLTILE